MRISLHQTGDELGRALASEIFGQLLHAQSMGQKYLLGCPSGRSPKPLYAALAMLFAEVETDLGNLVLVMMDEYLEGSAPPFRYVETKKHNSCRRFAFEEIAALFNANLAKPKHLPRENVWFPDPDGGAAYDDRIAAAGGVDMFILASGASDGHVAFNPPGSLLHGRSGVVELAEATRRDNLRTFPQFQSLEEVPRFGVSVGVGTIADQSKSAAMILIGDDKQHAYQVISQATAYDPDWPSTIIHECRNAVLYADFSAAQKAEI